MTRKKATTTYQNKSKVEMKYKEAKIRNAQITVFIRKKLKRISVFQKTTIKNNDPPIEADNFAIAAPVCDN